MDALVAAGGDGTVNIALQAVAQTDTPLGLLPLGTGNDNARLLGIPAKDPEGAIDVITLFRRRTVDVASVTTADGVRRYFLGVLSAGFDSLVTERANKLSWPKGDLRYVVAMLQEIRRFSPCAFTLEIDGKVLTDRGYLVAVGNGVYYGGGMRICEGAVIDDGLLQLTWLHNSSKWHFVSSFPKVFKGTHVTDRAVTQHAGREVRISAEGQLAYADGDRMGELPITVRVHPARAAGADHRVSPTIGGMSKSLALLLNATSANGRATRHWHRVATALQDCGHSVQLLLGTSADQSLDLAGKAVADGVDALVAVGGDGTVGVALQAVASTETPLGIIPLGTGNDNARMLGIPFHPARAVRVVAEARPRRIDVGSVTTATSHRYFLSVAAIGYDARANERADKMARPKGRARYLIAGLAELAALSPVDFTITVDGEAHQRARDPGGGRERRLLRQRDDDLPGRRHRRRAADDDAGSARARGWSCCGTCRGSTGGPTSTTPPSPS